MSLPRGYTIAPFEWRSWGEEAVVYVEATAGTHMLAAGVSRSLHALLRPGAAVEFPEMSIDVLNGLEQIGLVSRIPS